MTTKAWPTRSEQAMLRQQLGRLRPFDGPGGDGDPGTQHLMRDAHRVVEGSRRPGWLRRQGWLSH